ELPRLPVPRKDVFGMAGLGLQAFLPVGLASGPERSDVLQPDREGGPTNPGAERACEGEDKPRVSRRPTAASTGLGAGGPVIRRRPFQPSIAPGRQKCEL